MGKTSLFYNKQSGGKFAIEDQGLSTGNRFFVDSGNTVNGKDVAGGGLNPDVPFVTLDYAIGQCTANNGDIIYLMPGHAETLTAAGGVTCDIAGIKIIGLGEGSDRPTLTFSSTDNTASVLITAASTTIKNIIGICGDDGLTNPFHIQAADCTLDIEWRDGSATVEAAAAIVGTDAADRLNVKLKYVGFTGGNACVNAILLDGSNQARIDIDFFGKASTSIIEFNDTAVVDIYITGYFYNSGTTDLTKNVKDTATGSTWFVEGYDGAAGSLFSGGSGNTLAAGDLSVISTAVVTTIPGLHAVPTANATTNTNVRDVVGNKTDAAVGTVTTDKSLMGYVKGVLDDTGTTIPATITVIDAFHDVPSANATTNTQMRDVIGNKTDAAVTAVTTDNSLMGYLKHLVNQTTVREATGNADIDISAFVYTGYITLLTVTAPATGLLDCTIDLDLNKATTGWDTIATAGDLLNILVVKKVDGTNYRATQLAGAQITANGDGSLDDTESGVTFRIGPMQANASVIVKVTIDNERDDCEIPYRVTSIGAAPTITPVAAGA